MTDPIDIALDASVASAGAGTALALLFNIIHGIEAVIIGGLVIWLMVLRIRSHLRRDRIEEKEGPQREPAQTP